MITMQQALDDVSWLGQVVKIHSVGRYDIVEFLRKDNNPKRSKTGFSVFVDDKRTSIGASSIEEALLIGMAMAHDRNNSNMAIAATYAARVLNLPSAIK